MAGHLNAFGIDLNLGTGTATRPILLLPPRVRIFTRGEETPPASRLPCLFLFLRRGGIRQPLCDNVARGAEFEREDGHVRLVDGAHAKAGVVPRRPRLAATIVIRVLRNPIRSQEVSRGTKLSQEGGEEAKYQGGQHGICTRILGPSTMNTNSFRTKGAEEAEND